MTLTAEAAVADLIDGKAFAAGLRAHRDPCR
jgi:hypothetical protein